MFNVIEVINAIFAKEYCVIPDDEETPVEVKAGIVPFYKYRGKIISEAECEQICKQITEQRFTKEREKKREVNIAAIKRRYENHEEIMEVIDKLSDEHQFFVLDFLVSLRKKQRDELNWEEFKNQLLEREKAYLKVQKNKTK